MNTPLTVEVVSAPSKSKGWGRWSCSAAGVSSRTGNVWLYTGATGTAEGTFPLVVQTANRTKSGKETISTTTYELRADTDAVTLLEHRGDPQGMTLRVVGAVLVSSNRTSR